jgi:hypothetical protein
MRRALCWCLHLVTRPSRCTVSLHALLLISPHGVGDHLDPLTPLALVPESISSLCVCARAHASVRHSREWCDGKLGKFGACCGVCASLALPAKDAELTQNVTGAGDDPVLHTHAALSNMLPSCDDTIRHRNEARTCRTTPYPLDSLSSYFLNAAAAVLNARLLLPTTWHDGTLVCCSMRVRREAQVSCSSLRANGGGMRESVSPWSYSS